MQISGTKIPPSPVWNKSWGIKKQDERGINVVLVKNGVSTMDSRDKEETEPVVLLASRIPKSQLAIKATMLKYVLF